MLHELAGDRDVDVARTALGTLREQGISEGDVERLSKMIGQEGFDRQLDGDVVSLLAMRAQDKQAAETLAAILGRTNDPMLAAQVRAIRSAHESAM